MQLQVQYDKKYDCGECDGGSKQLPVERGAPGSCHLRPVRPSSGRERQEVGVPVDEGELPKRRHGQAHLVVNGGPGAAQLGQRTESVIRAQRPKHRLRRDSLI